MSLADANTLDENVVITVDEGEATEQAITGITAIEIPGLEAEILTISVMDSVSERKLPSAKSPYSQLSVTYLANSTIEYAIDDLIKTEGTTVRIQLGTSAQYLDKTITGIIMSNKYAGMSTDTVPMEVTMIMEVTAVTDN